MFNFQFPILIWYQMVMHLLQLIQSGEPFFPSIRNGKYLFRANIFLRYKILFLWYEIGFKRYEMVSYGTNAYLTVNNGLMFIVRNVKLMVRNGIFGYEMAKEHFDYSFCILTRKISRYIWRQQRFIVSKNSKAMYSECRQYVEQISSKLYIIINGQEN